MKKEMTIPRTITISKNLRKALNSNIVFTKEELTVMFGDRNIVTWLKLNCYLYQSSDCRWRKTDKLEEILAEGIEEIKT